MRERVMRITAVTLAAVSFGACSSAPPEDAATATLTAPGPTVTVTETAAAEPGWQSIEPTPTQVDALRQVCQILAEVPSFDSLVEYEPRPDDAAVQEAEWLSEKMQRISQDAAAFIFEVEAQETSIGRWILADIEGVDSVASNLESSAATWLRDPSDTNFHYWWASMGSGFHEVQRSRACNHFLSMYAEEGS